MQLEGGGKTAKMKRAEDDIGTEMKHGFDKRRCDVGSLLQVLPRSRQRAFMFHVLAMPILPSPAFCVNTSSEPRLG